MLEQLGSDRMLLFSSDYPHWHFDGDDALPAGLPADLMQKICVDNPLETYPRLKDAQPEGDIAMNMTVLDRNRSPRPTAPPSHLGFIDCDVHP